MNRIMMLEVGDVRVECAGRWTYRRINNGSVDSRSWALQEALAGHRASRLFLFRVSFPRATGRRGGTASHEIGFNERNP